MRLSATKSLLDKQGFLFILTAAFLIATLGFSHNLEAKLPPPQTVEQVDLARYQGLWFEYARLANRFQADCQSDTRAVYTPIENGVLKVENSCTLKSGKSNASEGRARIENASNSQLTVTFAKIFGRWIYAFGGDYWILSLENDYRWVLVGHPTRKFGWVLVRQPDILSEADKIRIRSAMVAAGYDPALFFAQNHTGFERPAPFPFSDKP